MSDPGNRRIQPVPGQIGQLGRVIRHFIGVVLLLAPAFFTPLAEFLECLVGADVIDIIVFWFSHDGISP
ncbi:hypothetical protein D3C75_1009870 [compost metagenome]